MESVALLLSSAGRRPYLVEWFQEALRVNDVDGRIVVIDADPHAPCRAVADTFLVAPPVVSEGYDSWLESTLTNEGIGLAVSFNDFELSHWANLGPDLTGSDRLLRLRADTQNLVEDKLLMANELEAHGVRVPDTRTGGAAMRDLDRLHGRQYVTKGRFGSASRGLRMVAAEDLPDVVNDVIREVTDSSGRSLEPTDPHSLEMFVVQERVHGDEFGLDVVSDLRGEHVTVLARRKISMRAGETDRAVSVDAGPFEELGRQLSRAIPHRGSIDVDVLVDADGTMWVIDVNPRFGGGYPFSHLAGANIPAAYVAWMTGAALDPTWLSSTTEVVSSKYVGIARSR